MLSLLNMNLRIPIWYIDRPTNNPHGHLKPYMDLTLVQPIPTTPTFRSYPQQPQQESYLVAKASCEWGKAQRKWGKDKETQVETTPTKPPNPTLSFALCDFHHRAINNFHNLPCIKSMVLEYGI